MESLSRRSHPSQQSMLEYINGDLVLDGLGAGAKAMKPSIPLLLFLLAFSVLSLLPLLPLVLLSSKSTPHSPPRSPSPHRLRVFVADLPRSFNYGLLDRFWSLSGPDSRIGVDLDARLRSTLANSTEKDAFPPYPESPLLKQHSAEYWLLGDLETPEASRAASFAERVYESDDADVVFVPFFSSLSAQMELGWGRKGRFRKRERNEDYGRQREVVDRIKSSEAWRRSGGRDHVFVMAGEEQSPKQKLTDVLTVSI